MSCKKLNYMLFKSKFITYETYNPDKCNRTKDIQGNDN